MSFQSWQEALAVADAAAMAQNTFTTAKSVINPADLLVLPAGFFTPGRSLRVTVLGSLSNIATTPGLVVFQLMLGSAVAYTTGSVQLNATAHTTLPFMLQVLLTCRAVGSGTSATLIGMGQLSGVMFTATAGQTDGANTQAVLQVPATAPAVGGGFDSTVANVLDLWAGFTISNAANQVQVQSYIVESLN